MSNLLVRRKSDLDLRKGKIGDKVFVSWDIVSDCMGKGCLLSPSCKYTTEEIDVKCGVQAQYINYVTQTIIDQYGKTMTEDQIMQFGLMVVPQFVHLCKMKIYESGLTMGNMVKGNFKTGSLSIHPIYKEIRETIKSIQMCYHKMGLNMEEGDIPSPNPMGQGKQTTKRGLNATSGRDGAAGYVEMLFDSGEES